MKTSINDVESYLLRVEHQKIFMSSPGDGGEDDPLPPPPPPPPGGGTRK